ncbi:MAG: hypothetical protein MJZ46_00205 [Bacteroidales bacterium]|nr:hypothetical protein [Bacteroidales bacterium]
MNPFKENERPQRSPLLLVLAILTFIGSGFSFLTYFSLAFSTNYMPAIIESYKSMGMPEEMMNTFEQLMNVSSWQYLLLSLGYALSIIGAALMLKLNKVGFHLYVISQIILFILCNLVIKGALTMNWFAIFTSVLFIVLYGMLLKDALFNKNNNYSEYEDTSDNQDEEDDE